MVQKIEKSHWKNTPLGDFAIFFTNTWLIWKKKQRLIYCGLTCGVPEGSPWFLGFAGTTLAGVERSDWENWIKTCIRTVTMANTTAENAIPFHEDRSEVHCKNFKAPKTSRHTQAITTCLLTKKHVIKIYMLHLYIYTCVCVHYLCVHIHVYNKYGPRVFR